MFLGSIVVTARCLSAFSTPTSWFSSVCYIYSCAVLAPTTHCKNVCTYIYSVSSANLWIASELYKYEACCCFLYYYYYRNQLFISKLLLFPTDFTTIWHRQKLMLQSDVHHFSKLKMSRTARAMTTPWRIALDTTTQRPTARSQRHSAIAMES
jgi:hypothetical protein